MRRKVSQAFLNVSHRKKFENHCTKGYSIFFFSDLILKFTFCEIFVSRWQKNHNGLKNILHEIVTYDRDDKGAAVL